MALEIAGAVQQAPHCGRHGMGARFMQFILIVSWEFERHFQGSRLHNARMNKLPILLLAVLGAAHAAETASMPTAPSSSRDWRAMAATDLEAARAAIRADHPGYIDQQNPAFRTWEAKGYEQARALLARVNSYDSMVAAVSYYIAGFEDGHLSYSSAPARNGEPVTMAGWRLDYVDGAYRVGAHVPHWPRPLPPLGAQLLSCDGMAPEQRLRQVGKYNDGRDLPGVYHDLASVFTALDMPGEELRQCSFRTADGKVATFRQDYRQVPYADFKELFKTLPQAQRFNAYSLQDGVLWIRAANFNPDRAAAQNIERMVEELPRLQGVRSIVFDTRGNGGGNSAIGDRIFDAATGGLEYDKTNLDSVPRIYAQWRVSDDAIASLESRIARMSAAQGADSIDVKWVTALRDSMRKAKADGLPWIEQPGSAARLTRADIVARNGKLRRFSGSVVLLTDENCASSCLNFADSLRKVPGAIHMGQATSADTVYIDVGHVRLPSGNHLVMPHKVWRNRLRGNNEALQPDVPLQVNMRDDAAVRQAVLDALSR